MDSCGGGILRLWRELYWGMFGLGLTEILVLAFVLLLFFGPFRINEVTKSIGQGIRKFKESKDEIDLTDSRPAQKPDRESVDNS